jgi:hypothetical protein
LGSIMPRECFCFQSLPRFIKLVMNRAKLFPSLKKIKKINGWMWTHKEVKENYVILLCFLF